MGVKYVPEKESKKDIGQINVIQLIIFEHILHPQNNKSPLFNFGRILSSHARQLHDTADR